MVTFLMSYKGTFSKSRDTCQLPIPSPNLDSLASHLWEQGLFYPSATSDCISFCIRTSLAYRPSCLFSSSS